MEKTLAAASALMLFSMAALAPFPGSLAAPTDGFVKQELRFDIQKPFNLRVEDRYTFSNGVHTMWIFNDDKPFSSDSPTKPRTEMRFRVKGDDYTSGVWQFEGDMYVPSGTTGVAVMQVMGGRNGVAAALQVRVYDGNLVTYGGVKANIGSNVYDRWIHVNVIHDADKKRIQIYLNGALSLDQSNPGTGNHYFKCGVYTQNDSSHRMESRWKNINIWKRATPAETSS